MEATGTNGEKVMVPKTRPEDTVPSVRTQRGAIFSRAEQDRLANANLLAQQEDGGSPPTGASGTASPQASSTASLPATATGAPARGGATTRSSTTRPRGQE